MSNPTTVTVAVPVTFEITVELPGDVPAPAVAAAIAARAAEHFAHVGQAQIHAFNEVNRIHRLGPGLITAASSRPDAAHKAAA
ncbi:hypothetical protein A6A40_22145 (plasmid) [Azospirillum humicireducens]|uniref:Uncharacterized protein n=1 Tax=Azospirillum humicireducens TaxID=1226968 RepID=A0A2R4VTB2_9PROT|nr:hypothetical protein [Azospirillum humicireducens]AWB07688.1 hypothetical protein A6A40_22145 [Azospirillum humicireducens]